METSPPSSIPIPVPAAALLLHLSSPSSQRDDPHNGTWRPYSNAADFDANVGMILIILVCALVSALALNAAVRFLLHRSRHPTQTQTQNTPDRLPDTNPSKLTNAADATRVMAPPMLVFSVAMKLAGAEAECAICLSEFVDGERVRVLPRCQHGFHVNCIQEWLSSHSSCPTCRSNYLLTPSPLPSPDKKPSSRDGDVEVDVESPPELS